MERIWHHEYEEDMYGFFAMHFVCFVLSACGAKVEMEGRSSRMSLRFDGAVDSTRYGVGLVMVIV